jgi:hypothetical protein
MKAFTLVTANLIRKWYRRPNYQVALGGTSLALTARSADVNDFLDTMMYLSRLHSDL